MENKNEIDILLQNEFQKFGFDYEKFIPMPPPRPSCDTMFFWQKVDIKSDPVKNENYAVHFQIEAQIRLDADHHRIGYICNIHSILLKTDIQYKDSEKLYGIHFRDESETKPKCSEELHATFSNWLKLRNKDYVLSEMEYALRTYEVKQKFVNDPELGNKKKSEKSRKL